MLTDREAANMRAEQVAAESSNRVHRAIRAKPADSGMVLRQELSNGAKEMVERLCEVYAKLDGAAEPPLRDQLTTAIKDRVGAFIQST